MTSARTGGPRRAAAAADLALIFTGLVAVLAAERHHGHTGRARQGIPAEPGAEGGKRL
jgi:hypothetical protein